MILKTLWAHRKQNGFVFAEIILITALSIYFIDYLVVTNHDRYLCRPAGDFEREHLLIGKIDNSYKEGEEMDSWEATFANIYAVRDRLRALPEVEHAGMAFGFIGNYGDHYFRLSTYSSEADSTRRCGAYSNRFLLHEQYFETQGLTPIEGSPSAAQLSEECPEDGVVISRSVALALFGTDQVVGRRIVEWDFSDQALQENGEAKAMGHYTIAGVLQDFRLRPYERYAYSILKPVTHAGDTGPEMLIRLRPDVDAEAFVSKLSERLNDEFRVGHEYLASIGTYGKYLENFTAGDITAYVGFVFIVLGLLMLNVVLGTLGTYWLQLRKRTEDIGIMRSFGAKRRDIFLMVWGEIALLTLVACFIGWIIWLQFAFNFGLSKGQSMSSNGNETDWVNNFWLHFLIICVIQYLVMLVIVTLGIIIPALIAMYRKPVNALRHE